MKEIVDILKAYQTALQTGRKMALATVVHVEGSSYRRPGARMLVTDDGKLTGAISGGCLEGDALRKALLAISQQNNKLVTYDTTEESDANFGVQLGCNGIVHILFEPIRPDQVNHPLQLLERVLELRQRAVLLTLFSLEAGTKTQPGTCLLYLEKENVTISNFKDAGIIDTLTSEARNALSIDDSLFKNGYFDGQEVTAFIELLKSPPSLVIAGAGNDALPLVEMANMMGWNTTVVDGRISHATRQRFPLATDVFVARPDEILSKVRADTQTFFILLTHNYNYDLTLLKQLIFLDECIYIGALGPRKKLERMFSDLKLDGIEVTDAQKSRIFGPVGLDIGAETSEEIALSVLAEIKAVLNGRNGKSLRDKIEPIHNRSGDSLTYSKTKHENFICAIQTDIQTTS